MNWYQKIVRATLTTSKSPLTVPATRMSSWSVGNLPAKACTRCGVTVRRGSFRDENPFAPSLSWESESMNQWASSVVNGAEPLPLKCRALIEGLLEMKRVNRPSSICFIRSCSSTDSSSSLGNCPREGKRKEISSRQTVEISNRLTREKRDPSVCAMSWKRVNVGVFCRTSMWRHSCSRTGRYIVLWASMPSTSTLARNVSVCRDIEQVFVKVRIAGSTTEDSNCCWSPE